MKHYVIDMIQQEDGRIRVDVALRRTDGESTLGAFVSPRVEPGIAEGDRLMEVSRHPNWDAAIRMVRETMDELAREQEPEQGREQDMSELSTPGGHLSTAKEQASGHRGRHPFRPHLGDEDRIRRIEDFVVANYGVTLTKLRGKTKPRGVAVARQILYFLIRKRLGWSFPEIGRRYGRDHSTVIHGVQRMEATGWGAKASEMMGPPEPESGQLGGL